MMQILGGVVTAVVCFLVFDREMRSLKQRVNELIQAQQRGFERIATLEAELRRLKSSTK